MFLSLGLVNFVILMIKYEFLIWLYNCCLYVILINKLDINVFIFQG